MRMRRWRCDLRSEHDDRAGVPHVRTWRLLARDRQDLAIGLSKGALRLARVSAARRGVLLVGAAEIDHRQRLERVEPGERGPRRSGGASRQCECNDDHEAGASHAREDSAREECPQRDSNPCDGLERAATWTASRWGLARKARPGYRYMTQRLVWPQAQSLCATVHARHVQNSHQIHLR
jgi:hypothetical protein